MRNKLEHKVRFDLDDNKSVSSPSPMIRSKGNSSVSGSIRSPPESKSTRVLERPEPDLPQFPRYPKFPITGSKEASIATNS